MITHSTPSHTFTGCRGHHHHHHHHHNNNNNNNNNAHANNDTRTTTTMIPPFNHTRTTPTTATNTTTTHTCPRDTTTSALVPLQPPQVRTWDASAYMTDELRQSRIETGHDESCRSCSWSPDGTMVASGSDDRSLRVWSTDAGQKITVFRDHDDWVNSIAWSPDSGKIVSGCGDGVVRVWSVREDRLLFELKGHKDWVEAVAWSSDGMHIASGAFERDPTIIIWDAVKGAQLFTCRGHEDRLLSLDFHPDGDALVSGAADNTARVWRVSSGDQERVLATMTSCVNAVRFCHTGVMVAVGCSDGSVSVFEFFSGDKLFYFQHDKHWIYCLAWSPMDTHIVAGSEDHTVRLTELTDFPAGTESDDDDDDDDASTAMHLLNVPNGRGSNRPFVPGFQLDSPVFSVSWNEDEGLICGCASGRLIQLSVCVKKGRRSTLAWEKSFRRTKKMSKSFRVSSHFSETSSVASPPKDPSSRPMTVHPPVEVPLDLGEGSADTKPPKSPLPLPRKVKSSICTLL
ncbi:hypothetical protein, variant [Salpingoeca rosetta]|uniref:Uncharacterized protein n=1 Tax=Salpingoeca rosetta (strain ATCC 50818 / BSB-021) TaxID=946362 RepID=F2UPW8_SALR5|nr:hypothetical protein, variant [Salpingoeca rosetta]EGD79797.1 hypothetical protein, variant [Salpingoeca rosetta]|eukprot:XP_004988746.1 hypothetical protein, variant [Salpingoeca rosetta]